MITNFIQLDFNKENDLKVPSVQYDSGSRFVKIKLQRNKTPFEIDGYRVTVVANKVDGTEIMNDCTILDGVNGVVQFEITEQFNAVEGVVDCQLKLFKGKTLLTSMPFSINVVKSVSTKEIVSSNELKTLVNALGEVQNIDNRFAQTNAQLSNVVANNAVCVIDFGADPTGVEDSTNSIRRAIASINAGVVYFPKGYYRFTESVVLKSGITIKGEDSKSTFICPDLSIMGVTSASLGVIPCFRTAKTESNISLYDIGFDCLKFNDDTKVSSILFATSYILDNFTAKNLYGIGQYQLLKFNRGDNYFFEDIHCDASEKILPEPSENILSFNKNNNIIINNIICKDSVEIIDFSDCDNCFVNNVIGHSQFSDENEAIDIGGSRNITIENVATDGFGQGIKLKQEGNNVITKNIVIKDCSFKNFAHSGIQFQTNYVIDDYVLTDITITNCYFEANSDTARCIYNIRTTNNYGVKDVVIRGCKFNAKTYAISMAVFKDLSIMDCEFVGSYKYNLIQCEIADDVKDYTKNGDVIICGNKYSAIGLDSSTAVYLKKINKCTVKNNQSLIDNKGCFLFASNCCSAEISNNEIHNFSLAIRYDISDFSVVDDVVDLMIKDNKIRNCNTSIRFSMDSGGVTTETVYKGIIINDNDILNNNNKDIGILLRGNYVTNGFDKIQVMNNRIFNTTTPVSEHKFTKGENCVIQNYIF